jgi:HPt (histidine-containing phosphotransfer) domain-containing protein
MFPKLRGGRLVAFAMLLIGFIVGTVSTIEVSAISSEIARLSNASTTDELLAGDERALASSIATDVVELQHANDRGQSPEAMRSELVRVAGVFDENLQALGRGGFVRLPSGNSVEIAPLSGDKVVGLMKNANDVWAHAYREIREEDTYATLAGAQVDRLASVVTHDTSDVSATFNELALQIGADAESAIDDLTGRRTYFTALAVLSVLLVLGAIFNRIVIGGANIRRYSVQLGGLLERFSARTSELFEAKRETDLIMSTVSQGLLLVDTTGEIAPHYSDEVRRIFRTDAIAGRTFLDLVRPLVPDKTLSVLADYFALLIDKDRPDRLLAKINPFDELEVNFASAQGGFESRYLGVVFRRIFGSDGAVSRIFIAVTDSTASVQFEKKLRAIEQKKDRQFGLLLSIINLEERTLDDFTATAREQVGMMNDALRAEDFAGKTQPEGVRKRLELLARAAHNVRGNAAAIGLDIFVRDCETFEDRLSDLEKQTAPGGDAFLGLVIVLANLRQHLDELVELRATLSVVRAEARTHTPAAQHARPVDFAGELQVLATAIGRTIGKSVVVRAETLDLTPLESVQRRALMDVLIQLTRNSVVHGIETRDARVQRGKPASGTILITSTLADESYTIEYRDDGAGIDLARIRKRIIAQGLATESAVEAMTEPQIIGAIFEPAFSTATGDASHAGRGMGLDMVKETILTRLDGKMNVDSHAGRHLFFRFRIPVRVLAHERS